MPIWSRSSKYQCCLQTSFLDTTAMNDFIMSNSYLAIIKMSLEKVKRRIYVTSASDNTDLHLRHLSKEWTLPYKSDILVRHETWKRYSTLTLNPKRYQFPDVKGVAQVQIYQFETWRQKPAKNYDSDKDLFQFCVFSYLKWTVPCRDQAWKGRMCLNLIWLAPSGYKKRSTPYRFQELISH